MKSYYDSIYNLPVYNFDVINKSHDYQQLMRDYERPAPSNVNLERLWNRIYDEYLAVYGLGEVYERYTRTRVEAARLSRKAYIEDQKHLRTIAAIKWQEAEDSLIDLDGAPLIEQAAQLSKFYGFRIDIMVVSVAEFKSYIENMKKEANNI